MTRFDYCLTQVLRHEGGYVDHPRDPGGATNFGITRKTLAGWRHINPWFKLKKSEVRTLKKPEVAAIYRALYWDRCRGALLANGLDHALFDYAVNSGPSRAIRHLQGLVGAKTDGVLGALTLKAIQRKTNAIGIRGLINALCDRRLGFLRRLSTYSTFGRGWRNRVEEVRRLALSAAGTSNHKTNSNNNRRISMNFLTGYKTYIVAIVMLLVGIGQMLGVTIPGFDGQTSGQLIIESLAVLFLRRGIKNEIMGA
ncbi:MAG TPA: hypothetical protein ENK61_01120 [Devosia sp.]|nr:hypothetical protein [Devosia sp.]